LDAGVDGEVKVTAVNGDVVGASEGNGITGGIITVQAIGGQIGGGPNDPLLLSSTAREINLATNGLSYVDAFGGGSIDQLINNLFEASFTYLGAEYRVATVGGQIIILGSVAREASGSVQRVSEEEFDEVSDALLKDEVEIYTAQDPRVKLPADQLDEEQADEAGSGLQAQSPAATGFDVGGMVAGEDGPTALALPPGDNDGLGRMPMPMPKSAPGQAEAEADAQAETAEAIEAGTPANSDALSTTDRPEFNGDTQAWPELSWSGQLPAPDGAGYGFAPTWQTRPY
jgi:hypothetical protein